MSALLTARFGPKCPEGGRIAKYWESRHQKVVEQLLLCIEGIGGTILFEFQFFQAAVTTSAQQNVICLDFLAILKFDRVGMETLDAALVAFLLWNHSKVTTLLWTEYAPMEFIPVHVA
eukprot:CAMPEP_0170895714 /NCGR_PEP_ID=MMETSP0734-20130129/44216_1 /TAXON_ID=186038 /ORGANISM="Fragilariopsis kerguelensis, Strain L26-C5" /LENGTH=117 /DNA_ID=CAMNT_0011287523 /DNA_START=199 /DNA_END=548 /DNA_ORIENTATION=-